MSLKTRLRVSIVTLVTLLVLAEAVVGLRIAAEANFSGALDRAQGIADQVRHLVLQRVNEQAVAATDRPSGVDESRAWLQGLVTKDTALVGLLAKTLAGSNAVVEILVCDDAGVILASSTSGRERVTYPSLPDFMEWKTRPLWDRLVEVLTQSKDYAIVVPLAIQGQQDTRPVLTIRVLVSSVLIRNAILPQVQTLAGVSLGSLVASVILAYLFSNVVLRALDRLSQRIERIATGEFMPEGEKPGKEAKEFADVQSKLDVLSQQFQGAREDVVHLRQNIERMLDRLEKSVLLFDAEHKLVRASPQAGQLLGLGDPIAGRRLEELFPATTPVGSLVRETLESGRSVRNAQVDVERPESGPSRLLVNVEPLEGFPEPGRVSVLVTLRDVETRRQIQSQLDISTRLAAISRLTGGVAHEIKNPLNSMALHLEILKSKLEGDDRVENEVGVIGGEIARLDRVVKTFLDFTRPVELKLADLNLVELARQVAALVWPEAERFGVSVELDAPQERMMVRGDQDLLKQALLNVMSNGMEAMATGGRLRVEVYRDTEDAVVSVSDQGSGIPDELRERIFNLYFTTKDKGSGIGLAMTFRIVQLHNATMDFTSEVGVGTTFRLRFPATEVVPSEAAS